MSSVRGISAARHDLRNDDELNQSFASRLKILKIVFICPPAKERIANSIEP